MKKLICLLMLAIACVSCNFDPSVNQTDSEFGWNYIDNQVKFRKVIIDEQQYILFMTNRTGYDSPRLTVVHSESCPCKNKKK